MGSGGYGRAAERAGNGRESVEQKGAGKGRGSVGQKWVGNGEGDVIIRIIHYI